MTRKSDVSSEILTVPEIRVSCCGLANIQDGQGRYVLMTNRGVLRHANRKTITPIGGGLALTPEGKDSLRKDLGIVSFERDRDMRFTMSGSKAPVLIDWMLARVGRELDPLRELKEELAQEHPFLLSAHQLEGTTSQLRGYHSYVAPSPLGTPTFYVAEVSDVVLPDQALVQLHHHATTAYEPWVHLVTADEIQTGMTKSGIEIGRISESLLYANKL